MSHDYIEIKEGILIQIDGQRCIRVHAYIGKQVDGHRHEIQILDGHYSTVQTTICGNGIVHRTTEVIVGSIQCFIVDS